MKIILSILVTVTLCASGTFTALAENAPFAAKENRSGVKKSHVILRFVECADQNGPSDETVPMKGSGEPVGLTGPDICDEHSVEKAITALDAYGRPAVFINFTPEGGAVFADATKRLIRKKIAVIFKGEVISCPLVMAEITGGKVQIMGAMTATEAEEIVKAINAAKSGTE